MSPSNPSRLQLDDLWRPVCAERGGDFLRAPNMVGMRVPFQHGTVTLRVVWSDSGSRQELRAPFANHRGVHFDLAPQRPKSWLGRLLWPRFALRRDILAGEVGFDDAFRLGSKTPVLAQELFDDAELRSLCLGFPSLSLSVRTYGSPLGYPDGVDELYSHGRPLAEPRRLNAALDVVEALLERLALMSKVGDSVQDQLRVLNGPRGVLFSGAAAWDGRPARRHAAEALGAAGSARAVRSLMRALDDPDDVLRAKAIAALGSIGDSRAVPVLVPLLGARDEGLTRPLAEDAAEALRALGEEELVDAFLSALEGDHDQIRLHGDYKEGLGVALVEALDGPGRAVQGHVFAALAELGAVDALPVLRARLESIQIPGLAQTCREAIAKLEGLQGLPRPAARPGDSEATLPRPSDRRTRES